MAIPTFLALPLAAQVCFAQTTESKAPPGDMGRRPWVVNIEELTTENPHFRAAKWTGKRLQMTVMTIPPGGEIGLEVHPEGDQFIRVEEGRARVVMGPARERLTFDRTVSDDWAIFIPAGAWHNILNEGREPLKVYVIYSPPEHPPGTLHRTPEDSARHHGH
ncbi:MAG: cupin domain-containing protein [Synechococcaceae cyanobacterium]|nr:cupin domain-containing protein [Synechococcaceae cyanobacterium]